MNKNIYKLDNIIQNYAWGSKTAISDLFGFENVTNEPQAEIWMGAHPNGCSKVLVDNEPVLLSELIQANKSLILSPDTAEHFGELPYLFKVLSAGSALSVQVHPNKEEAQTGFAKEDALKIDRKADNRNYRDCNHKPELVYALTAYQAMNGFRSFADIIDIFVVIIKKTKMPHIELLLSKFKNDPSPIGLEAFFVGILSLKNEAMVDSIDALMEVAVKLQKPNLKDDIFTLIVELSQTHPKDIGLFSPLMLNVLTLNPGEAMYLDARTPHAYLKGTGLEVMANSDNVLRAGLTSKHIDVNELANCTLFQEKTKNSLLVKPLVNGNRQSYLVPVPDFKFDCFVMAESEIVEVRSAEIIFSIDCDVKITHEFSDSITLKKGESAFIPAYAGKYTLNSEGRIARVFN
ncbi:mannose-6-phosphate isomerase, class I [Vibrio splendidus]|uniref:mannose-6-phosphate isomerase n=1 Tax=Vibrio splendidus TaxID=29497 RepID=A0AB35N2S5_VIBSP|nr:mannose-6-phosphate isomerase, class I [Vibrio splendidus]MDP2502853.1 mannose-6-phosphate isomerase, class I [Vibrio splendidus]PMG54847.1 mannose-6-phosphate isomerase, class I [Vibrio splendidus]PMM74646.1 mannose-6-phosphate isomerase, class I [Vibrio splendidus]